MSWNGDKTDIWRVGMTRTPIHAVTDPLKEVVWLPEQRDFCFLADPFGIRRGEDLHVFVEAYDYRDKHGVIRRFTYDADLKLVDEAPALRAAHHLSYPFLIEDGAEVFMLPEAHTSGKLTLYRARAFPNDWEQVCDVLDAPAIDASVIKHNGRWWMFYALPGPHKNSNTAMRELYAAHSMHLTGPWTPHPMNPIRTDIASSRPGGTPFVHEGALHLPTQDCTRTYGGAVNILRIDELTDKSFRAAPARRIEALPFDGLHTLSMCGDVTLFDVKHIERGSRIWINLQRRWRRAMRAVGRPG